MPTKMAQAVGAVVAALSLPTPVSSQIHRSRVRPLAAEWTTAVVVTPRLTELDRFAIRGAPINLETQIEVACYARAAPGQSPDVGIDALLSVVYGRIVADPTLGATVLDAAPTSISFDFDAEADQVAGATITLFVQHQAAALTLE
jgi:hypothetical protein